MTARGAADLALERHATSKLATDERSRRHRHARLPRRGAARDLRRVPLRSAHRRARGAPSGLLSCAARAASVSEQLAVAAPSRARPSRCRTSSSTRPARLKFLKTAPTELAASAARRAPARAGPSRASTCASPTTAAPSSTAPARARACASGSARSTGFETRRAPAGRSTGASGGVARGRAHRARPQLSRGNRDDDHGHRQRPTGARHAADCRRCSTPTGRCCRGTSFPLAVLAIELAAAARSTSTSIPTKAWVRFRAPARRPGGAAVAAVQDALRQPTSSAPGGLDAAAGEPGGDGRRSRRGRPDGASPRRLASARCQQAALFREARRAVRRQPSSARVVGQLQDTFIVSTTDDEVFFVDQHVAHERVLFERLRGRARRRARCRRRSCSSRSRSSSARGQAGAARALARRTLERLGLRARGIRRTHACSCARCPRSSRARSPGG